jgi:hypothetical protein
LGKAGGVAPAGFLLRNTQAAPKNRTEAKMQDLEQAIRERAYHLWAEGGRPDGQANAHWLEAQRQILSVSLAGLDRTVTPEAAPARPKKKRAPRKSKSAA